MIATRTTRWLSLLLAGLLASIAGATTGDFNGDSVVDSLDFDLFKACASGPVVPYALGCDDKIWIRMGMSTRMISASSSEA